ncbi:Zinc finger (MYND type) family protein [Hibiscus syriacus]|uniref:Zinc finger (MYND type) family protein n=1 Tax=Hibiscus syriacus TaxID=106335 RepID=A0A6A3C5K1_HIBSY|nr:Zinc finger (MYND type) family protein [Hibiscus syriacus]
MDIDGKGDSMDELKGLRFTPLDDDEDDEDIAVDEDDNDDDEDDDDEAVILGFVEKPEHSWSLLRQQFPSKAGGVPSWLDPDNLPSGISCVCDICGEPLQFLLQVYAPLVEKDSTFHRTLFVFMCLSMKCLLRDQHEQWKRHPDKQSRSVKVFRCQLPRTNPYYSSKPPEVNASDKPLTPGAPLCNWCGTWKGDKFCSSCKVARYCSQKHQVMHWRSGHKLECQQPSLSPQSPEPIASKSLWPEYEIKNEHESEYDTEMSGDEGHTNNSLITRNRVDGATKSLMDYFEGDGDKKSWASFQERIAKAPEQVLRYCRSAGSKPLWPILGGHPSKADIPLCSYCGGRLCFEFQILPQLLYFFGVKNDADSLDWATIAVYTCEASCEGVGYEQEFAWVQLGTSINCPS